MTIVFCQDPTGPDPLKHEIFQIGALFCPDDLSSVRQEFSCYVTPKRFESADLAYLSRQGIRSIEELQERAEYWGSPETVWSHFASLAEKGGSSLSSARVVCFDAATDAPFLRKCVERSGVEPGELTRNIGGLVQATLDIGAYTAYLGQKSEVTEAVRSASQYDRDKVCTAVFGAHGVSCDRLSDAKKRAEATRQSYRSILMQLKNSTSTRKNTSSYDSGQKSPTVRRR